MATSFPSADSLSEPGIRYLSKNQHLVDGYLRLFAGNLNDTFPSHLTSEVINFIGTAFLWFDVVSTPFEIADTIDSTGRIVSTTCSSFRFINAGSSRITGNEMDIYRVKCVFGQEKYHVPCPIALGIVPDITKSMLDNNIVNMKDYYMWFEYSGVRCRENGKMTKNIPLETKWYDGDIIAICVDYTEWRLYFHHNDELVGSPNGIPIPADHTYHLCVNSQGHSQRREFQILEEE